MDLSPASGRTGTAPASRRRRPAASIGFAAGLTVFMLGLILVVNQMAGAPIAAPAGSTSTDMSVVAAPPDPDLYGWEITRYAGRPALVPDGPINGVAFTMQVPKLNYSAVVRVGTGLDILNQGPGWYPDTGWPGQPGNVGIAGHNSFWLAFSRLGMGDRVTVTTRAATYTYEITGTRVVDPSDRSVLVRTADPQLTLTTCYPLWAGALADKRLIFNTRLVSVG